MEAVAYRFSWGSPPILKLNRPIIASVRSERAPSNITKWRGSDVTDREVPAAFPSRDTFSVVPDTMRLLRNFVAKIGHRKKIQYRQPEKTKRGSDKAAIDWGAGVG